MASISLNHVPRSGCLLMEEPLFEPRHEETNILPMQKQRHRSAYQRLYFHYYESTVPIAFKSEISSL